MGSTSVAVLVTFLVGIAVIFLAINLLARRIADAKTKDFDIEENGSTTANSTATDV